MSDRIQTLATFEPMDDSGDVHSASTAVAVLPDSFLDDLKRGKADEAPTSRYKVLPESDLSPSDAPTLPPPVSAPSNRVRQLNATVSAALAAPPLDMTPFLTRPPTLPDSMYPIPIPISLPPPPPPRARWSDVMLTVVFVLAVLASAASVALAIAQAVR